MDKKTQDHILNVLRQGTVTWHLRNECLNRGRRRRKVGEFKNGKDKLLWERQCDGCGTWKLIKDGELEIDHLEEVGGFEGCFDKYVRRMYCDSSNLQALCFVCHKKKTAKGNASIRYARKNKDLLDEL